MNAILVVDNEKSMRDLLVIVLSKEGYLVETAEDGEKAVFLIEQNLFDLVITDMKMPHMDGMELLKIIKKTAPDTMVVMMTAFASMRTAVDAMKEGAHDYLVKPFQMEEIKLLIRNIFEKKRLRLENRLLRHELKGRSTLVDTVGTRSPKMLKVLELVRKVAESKSSVIIYGESGSGKELIARAIHEGSSRVNCPFVTINCSALPETLLESELFGYMQGAFTGAVAHKAGLFEIADEGSLLLDEIGDIPMPIQAKLLRVLQEQEFRRVGGTKSIKVDVRIIAATHRNLKKMVDEGDFREDLYYRLDVIPIHVPPLRDRVEDIPLLTNFFIREFNQVMRKTIEGVSPDMMEVLTRHEWKGNIRELKNSIERAMTVTSGQILMAHDFNSIPVPVSSTKTIAIPTVTPEDGFPLEDIIEKIERELLLKALDETSWVQNKAAKLLHLDFRSFRYRLSKYGIKKDKPPAGLP